MSVHAPHRRAFRSWELETLAVGAAKACSGWRGPALAALIALIVALPGLLALPALDGGESRSAQATVQMLETGDLLKVRFEGGQFEPPGVHWLQAASVKLFSKVEDRDVRAYRIPSLLGAMLAAAACAWGASAAFGSRAGTVAGALLGGGLIASSAAFTATADALLCGMTTLAMAGLCRIYLAERGDAVAAGWRERTAVWVGLGCGVLAKGFVAPIIVGLTILALAIFDRRAAWIRRLGWGWGLIATLLIVGPWAFSITVASDGGFWAAMLGGLHDGRAGPPGELAGLAPILDFPFALILPPAAIGGWERRREPGVRIALAWVIPAWLVLECLPGKTLYSSAPLYGALAWLAAAASARPAGVWPARFGAILGGGVGIGLAAGAVALAVLYGGGSAESIGIAALVAGLTLTSGGLGAWRLLVARPGQGLLLAGVFGAAALMTATGFLLPRLPALWVSQRAARLIDDAGLDPRDGRTVGPVAVAGYGAPSLVFALGSDTEVNLGGAEAADALAAGSPVFVEQHEDAAFRQAVAERGAVAQVAGAVAGFDYVGGRDVRLTLWRPTLLAPTSQPDTTPPATPDTSPGRSASDPARPKEIHR